MRILGIDPGQEQSGHIIYNSISNQIASYMIVPNDKLLVRLGKWADLSYTLAIEMVESRGMPMPTSLVETVLWIGQFMNQYKGPYVLIYPRNIRICLCGTAQAKKKNVRQAIIDRFPATGGGKVPQIGIKVAKGPLYGIGTHLWSALAVALVCAEKLKENDDV